MKKILVSTIATLSIFSVQTSLADITVHFIESAPKDSFVIENTGECVINKLLLTIDLSQSDGKLIFDTSATGAGVEVFQPFEVSEGDIKLASLAEPKDGDNQLSLSIKHLSPQTPVSITIDVDDTLPKSELGQIRVSNTEIKNATVTVNQEHQQAITAVFGNNNKATASLPSC